MTFGTPAHMLARADGPDTSKAAAMEANTTRLEELIYNTIKERGPAGCIASELLETFTSLPYSSVTARFAGLERKGLITCGPDKRKGPSSRNQRVLRAANTTPCPGGSL